MFTTQASLLVSALCAVLLWSAYVSAQESDTPILTFDQRHPLLLRDDPTPLVQVFASGRVVVHRPAGVKRSGTFEFTISEDQLQQLTDIVAPVSDSGVTGEQISAQAELIVETSNTRSINSDPTTTILTYATDLDNTDSSSSAEANATPASDTAADTTVNQRAVLEAAVASGEVERVEIQDLTQVAEEVSTTNIDLLVDFEQAMQVLFNRAGGSDEQD